MKKEGIFFEGKLKSCPGNLSLEDQQRYAGLYVCVPSFQGKTVVSAHLNAAVAIEQARERGMPTR